MMLIIMALQHQKVFGKKNVKYDHSDVQNKVINNSIKCKLVDSIIELLFGSGCILFGGAVRDYQLSKQKMYPTDFDIGVDNISEMMNYLIEKLGFSFDIEKNEFKYNEIVSHAKIHLKYKFSNATSKKGLIEFDIDISEKSVIGSNLDFDVNGVYMPDSRSYHLVNQLPPNSLCDVIDHINKRKFTILKTFKKPKISRIQMGISESSKKLIEFLKIMERTCKMFNRGWKLNDQKIEEIFEPCLIKENNPTDDNEKKCTICGDDFKKYELELDCCQKMICFVCALEHVKSRFANSEIPCPYCRGDPFGWNTVGFSVDGDNTIVAFAPNVDNFNDELDQMRNAIRSRQYRNSLNMEPYHQDATENTF